MGSGPPKTKRDKPKQVNQGKGGSRKKRRGGPRQPHANKYRRDKSASIKDAENERILEFIGAADTLLTK